MSSKLIGNTTPNLYQIWRNFDEGRWHLPSHQRKLVWSKAKMKKWFSDLVNLWQDGGGLVPGCIIVYRLQGETKEYLNDGAQRAYWTIKEFINYCNSRDLNWKDILSSVSISVQAVEYENVNEAIRWFIQINCGTYATAFELTRTLFCENFSNFVGDIEPKLKQCQDAVNTGLIRLGCKIEKEDLAEQRDSVHKKNRDTYNMLYLFLSGDKHGFNPQVALTTINPDKWDQHSKLEQELINCIKKSADFEKDVDSFKKFIENRIALFLQIWAEIKPPTNAPSNVAIRWWLAVSLIFKNNNADRLLLRDFTEKLIRQNNGRTALFYQNPNGQTCNTNTAMAKMSNLTQISKIIGFDITQIGVKQRRKRPKEILKPGFVHSHVDAFCVSGEGVCIPENAMENLHRLNRDMTEIELERLESIND